MIIFIVKTASANGTAVNGAVIGSGNSKQLNDGDCIAILYEEDQTVSLGLRISFISGITTTKPSQVPATPAAPRPAVAPDTLKKNTEPVKVVLYMLFSLSKHSLLYPETMNHLYLPKLLLFQV